MFEQFEKNSQRRGRRRFRASLATSLVLCSGAFGGLVAASAVARTVVDEDDLLQVEFALPEEPPPPPPVAVPPPPAPKPRRQELAPPKEIPDEKAAEADGPLAETEPVREEPPAAEAVPAPAIVEAETPTPAPAPRPKAEGPVQLPEQAIPPVAMAGNTPPAYPEEARKTGVQAVVIAKIVVRADGSVGSVQVLRGPEVFHAAVKAALMTWRYQPARLPDGTAIAVFRIVQLPFKLENM